MQLSRALRAQLYYSIPEAGALLGWTRSEAYRAVWRGDLPTEWQGKFRLVPRRAWDITVRRVRRQLRGKVKRRSQTARDPTSSAVEAAPQTAAAE